MKNPFSIKLGSVLALLSFALVIALPGLSHAELKLPAMFTDHAVLQREMPVPVWGWAEPGEEVTVAIAGQTQKTKVDDKGKWRVTLSPLTVGEPLKLVVESGKDRLERKDILVGEVWLCSGQSNMDLNLNDIPSADLDVSAANFPQIRLIDVKQPGSQKPAEDFDGAWQICSPQTVGGFSAVGYFFGRELHAQLGVPIGLVDNSWGSSTCEAWIRRDRLEGNPKYEALLKRWDKSTKSFDEAKWNTEWAAWRAKAEAARKAGKPAPQELPITNDSAVGPRRPANMYYARLEPVKPYAIRGAIWYQGEANSGRAYQYREMFPLMISTWREDWKEGDFPFYWVQLAGYTAELPEPGDSMWAELREAQTMTQDKLPHTGQAVIVDLGESSDIHPKKKFDVGRRLARWALARDYGKKVAYQSPRYELMEKQDDKIVLKFKDVGGGLRTVNAKDPKARNAALGFAIAGVDRKWHWAQANITKPNEIEVSSKDVKEPVAVRYAWADNPVCNVYSMSLLPLTPFRTDDWPGLTVNNKQ